MQAFSSLAVAREKAVVEKISVEHALSEMKQPKPDDYSTGRVPTPEFECERIGSLLIRYQETEESMLNKYLDGYSGFQSLPESTLIRQLQEQAKCLRKSWQPIPIIDVIAGIGAAWTMTTSGKKFRDSGGKKETLLRLHNIQIIGLIRLLKLSEEQQHVFWAVSGVETGGFGGHKLMAEGHMIHVGTGEGKSVLLGLLSCFLAMTGIHVRCACCNKLLSRRDYSNFEVIFEKFNVKTLIKYSTIDELAEECINENCDIRSLVLRHLCRRVDSSTRRPHDTASSATKVLLIDEVHFILCLHRLFVEFLTWC